MEDQTSRDLISGIASQRSRLKLMDLVGDEILPT